MQQILKILKKYWKLLKSCRRFSISGFLRWHAFLVLRRICSYCQVIGNYLQQKTKKKTEKDEIWKNALFSDGTFKYSFVAVNALNTFKRLQIKWISRAGQGWLSGFGYLRMDFGQYWILNHFFGFKFDFCRALPAILSTLQFPAGKVHLNNLLAKKPTELNNCTSQQFIPNAPLIINRLWQILITIPSIFLSILLAISGRFLGFLGFVACGSPDVSSLLNN